MLLQPTRAHGASRPFAGALAWLSVPLVLAACPRTASSVPAGSDPEKVARAEFDVARDELSHGRLRSAMEHAIKASDADENFSQAHTYVAQIYLALCQTENDCRFEDAEKYARKGVAADPEDRPAKLMLGVVLVNEKKYDEAIDLLRVLCEDIVYKTPWLAWYNLGFAYGEKGDSDKAIDAETRALALNPSFCLAHYRLGLVYEKRGESAKANDEYTAGIDTCANLQAAFFGRGRVRTTIGQKDRAREDYQSCVKLDPSTLDGRGCADALKGMP